MLRRAQVEPVRDAIWVLRADDRCGHVLHASDVALPNLQQDTGKVITFHDRLAAKIGCEPTNASHVVGALEHLRVIRRERCRAEGGRS